MALKRGYDPSSTYSEASKSAEVTAFNKSIKASTRMKKSIHPDEENHPPGCSEPSTRMQKTIHPDAKKHRGACKEREGMTQDEFLALNRSEQLALFTKYDSVKDKDFDDGTFAFSVTQFKKLREQLGFARVIIDTKERVASSDSTIVISREKRNDVKEKKLTLSASTIASMNELFADVKLTNEEKSKVIDELVRRAITDALDAKRNNKLSVEYAEKLEAIQQKNTLM